MTDTTTNVPRELLDSLLTVIESNGYAADEVEVVDELRALLSAPSPAGVDGLNTDRNAAFKACPEAGCDWGSFYLGWKARGEVEQAIIDGLRGKVAELESTLADNLELSGKRAVRIAEIGHELADAISERDQHAHRIGELEGLLQEAYKYPLNHACETVDSTAQDLCERIDAALSPDGVDGLVAVKVWEADADWDDHELVVRLSAAQTIIDGLRGEIADLLSMLATVSKAGLRVRTERDQHAQRIGELEGLLRAESARVDFLDAYIVTADAPDTGKAAMLADSGTLRECIDAALSAGKEGE